MKDHMLSAGRDIFSTELATQEHHTIMQLQEYTKFAKQITRRSIADAKEHGKHFKKINQYFPIKMKIGGNKIRKENATRKTRTWKRNTQETLVNHLKRPPPKIPPPQPCIPRPG